MQEYLEIHITDADGVVQERRDVTGWEARAVESLEQNLARCFQPPWFRIVRQAVFRAPAGVKPKPGRRLDARGRPLVAISE